MCVIKKRMEHSESIPNEPIQKVGKVCDTKEGALQAVKAFWSEAHPDDLEMFGIRADEEYEGELTGFSSGDRTFVRRAIPTKPENRGKWEVVFTGNNQPLSERSVDYLRSVGVIEGKNS